MEIKLIYSVVLLVHAFVVVDILSHFIIVRLFRKRLSFYEKKILLYLYKLFIVDNGCENSKDIHDVTNRYIDEIDKDLRHIIKLPYGSDTNSTYWVSDIYVCQFLYIKLKQRSRFFQRSNYQKYRIAVSYDDIIAMRGEYRDLILNNII